MSCGSPKRHAKLGVRVEVARMVLQSAPQDFDTMFPKVITAVCSGIDLDAEDQDRLPFAIGDSAVAVASRNALMNAPLADILGLDRGASLMLAEAGAKSLGALVQMDSSSIGMMTQGAASVLADLRRYGLTLGMDANSIRDWILKGPK